MKVRKVQLILLVLLLAARSSAEPLPSPNLPEFSWDNIPRWGFLSFRDTAVSAEEARYMADNFPIATLFWLPGGNPQANQRAEEMMLASAETVKRLNPDIKLLYYWNSTLASDHYAAYREFEANPDWKMIDKDGNDVTVRKTVLRYDVTHPELRDWWSEQAAIASRSPYIDGVFADAVGKIELHKRIVFDNRMNPGDFEAAINGMHGMLALAKQKMGEGKILAYNGLRGDLRPGMWKHGGVDYLNEADGACMEHFLIRSVRAPVGKLRISHVLRDMELIREACARGKLVLVKAWPKTTTFLEPEFQQMSATEKEKVLQNDLLFPLALFLIAAEKNCYFNYSFGYRRECLPLYHLTEYDKQLGPPDGLAKQHGLIFTRSFEHADVWVDLGSEQAEIRWK